MIAKVQNIRTVEETVESYVQSFYNEYKVNSISTAENYTRDVISFLKFSSELGVNYPISNIHNIFTYKNVTAFRQHESERIKAISVNRKMAAIREFGKHLSAHGTTQVNLSFFQSIKSNTGDANSYDVISIHEAIQIAEWLKENEKVKAIQKYYYTLLAIDTGVRAEALSKLTPSHFIKKDNEVMLKGVDKGNKSFSKRVSLEVYEEMKKDLDWKDKKEVLFNFSAKNRADMMKRALKGLGWEDRNIAFHSFKKAAVNNAFEQTGNIMVAMKVGNHSSVSTTQTYLAEGDDFLGAISSGGRDIGKVDLQEFSKEELIKAINQLSKNAQYQVKTNLVNNVDKEEEV